MTLHRLLARQLRKSGITLETSTPQVQALIAAVNEAYLDFDTERKLLERAMDLSSTEMNDANQKMCAAVDKAQAAVRSKSEFLANMSHEIRTPMNGVLGLSEILLESELTNEQREHVEILHSSARGLVSIVNDVLDLSKIESGRFEIIRSQFNVREMLKEIGATFAATVRKKHLTFEVVADDRVPQDLIGDDIRLRQVLINLIGNAMKFNPSNGVVLVYLDVRKEGEGRHTLHAAVCDTGIGIPEERLSSIFDPFTQVDSSTTRAYGGTGLGLTISNRLLSLMSGTLSVRSIVGRGSAFHLTLPIEVPRPIQDPSPLDASRASQGSEDGGDAARHVLVVEDNQLNQKVVCHLLAKLGWSYTVAQNGRQAVELYKAARFDLILMDCQMPILSGYDATQEIRELEVGGSHRIPIIAMTAHALDGDRERCLDSGMDDYLTKPFQFSQTRELLLKWAKS